MLRVLFIILLGISVGNSLIAQSYIAFPETNAKWVWEDYYYDLTSDYPNKTLDRKGYSFELLSDTLLNGKLFKNVGLTSLYTYHCFNSYDGFHCSNTPTVDNTDIYRGYVGALREEAKRIYYYQYADAYLATFGIPDTSEILLYDFNYSVGDTIKGMADSAEIVRIISDTLSWLLNDGLYHKSYAITGDEYWTTDRWYEGFGSIQFLFGPYEGLCESCSLILRCFKNEDEYVYGFDNCEELILSSVESSVQPLPIRISPNPFHNDFKISGLPEGREMVIELISSDGRVVCSKQTKHQNDFMNVNKIPAGSYFIRIYSNDETIFSSVIVKF